MHPQIAPTKPGRVISIIGLVLPFIGLAIVGIVLSIIGLVKSKRAGKVDVLAIIGVIVNVFGILAYGIIALLVLVAYQNLEGRATDTMRKVDAAQLITTAEKYRQGSQSGTYPSTDSNGFIVDIETLPNQRTSIVDVASKLSSSQPSAMNPDVYTLSYCGGPTAAQATGMEVHYWSDKTTQVEALTTGSGCASDGGNAGMGSS